MTAAAVGEGDEFVEASAIGRLGVNEAGGFTHDGSRMLFDKGEADDAGDKHGTVDGLGVAIDVAEFAGEPGGEIRAARRVMSDGMDSGRATYRKAEKKQPQEFSG